MKPFLTLRRFAPAMALCLLAALLPACSLLPFQHSREESGPVTTASLPDAEPAMVGKRLSSFRGLTVEMKAAPDPVKLGEVRHIDVTLSLRNDSKQNTGLKFATSQTIEIILREQDTGKIVSQWSTDQVFAPGSRYVVVNAHERIEYNQPITTRELKPGKTYQLQGYFIGYEHDLHASRPIIPLP